MTSIQNVQFLSNDQLAKQAPSIFAANKAPTRSEKYTYVPTLDIVEEMRRQGFFPVQARESKTRIVANQGYTKHRILFAREERKAVKGEYLPYISIVGSHNGASQLEGNAGCKVWRCDNGLMADDASFGAFKVPHKGDILGDVIEGVYSILGNTHLMADQLEEFRGIHLPRSAQLALAKSAIPLRWDAAIDGSFGVEPQQLLIARRRESAGNSLFDVFNNIQENIIRGQVPKRAANGKVRNSREVKSVNEDQRLNKALWTLSAEMARLVA